MAKLRNLFPPSTPTPPSIPTPPSTPTTPTTTLADVVAAINRHTAVSMGATDAASIAAKVAVLEGAAEIPSPGSLKRLHEELKRLIRKADVDGRLSARVRQDVWAAIFGPTPATPTPVDFDGFYMPIAGLDPVTVGKDKLERAIGVLTP